MDESGCKTIGIFGHYGHENLGDEAIIAAVIQRVSEYIPRSRIVLFSSRPADSRSRHGLEARPIRRLPRRALSPSQQVSRELERGIDYTGASSSNEGSEEGVFRRNLKRVPGLWPFLHLVKDGLERSLDILHELAFLRSSAKALRDVDMLIVTGSNQFLDNYGGPWGFPYTILKWSILCRLVGVRLAFLSVGAGPLDRRLSRWMIRFALKHSCYLSFRDAASRNIVDAEGKYGGVVYPDLAFSIDAPENVEVSSVSGMQNLVAINPMPVFDARYWYFDDAEKYTRYTQMLAGVIEGLVRRNMPVRMFATHPKDENVMRDIGAVLQQRGYADDVIRGMFTHLSSVQELLVFLLSVSVVIPTRFHGTVLALWAEKPTIAVCYHRKMADLLASFGQDALSFDLESVSSEELLSAVDEVIANAPAVEERIAHARDAHINALREQYECIARLIG